MFTSVRAFVVHRNAHNAPIIGQHTKLTTQAQAGKCHAWITEAVLEKSARNQRQSTKAVGRASSKRFISHACCQSWKGEERNDEPSGINADTDDQIVMPQITYATQTPSMANVASVAGMSATSAVRLVSFFLKTSTYASTRLITAPRRIAPRSMRLRDPFPSSFPFCGANSSTSSVTSPTSANSSTRAGRAASSRTHTRRAPRADRISVPASSKPLTRRATPSTSAPQTITWLLVCTMGLLGVAKYIKYPALPGPPPDPLEKGFATGRASRTQRK